MGHLARVLLALLWICVSLAPLWPASAQPVMNFNEGDREMKAAIQKARATLNEFWQAMERRAPGEEGFTLKVRVPVVGPKKDEGEHIWIDRVERLADGRVAGRLANQPRRFKGKVGERRVFSADQITDWMFRRNGKFVGMETMRPVLKRMSPEEAEQMRARMEQP